MDIVITTIFPPTQGTRLISTKLQNQRGKLWVMGDRPGPESYDLPNIGFYDLQAQSQLLFSITPPASGKTLHSKEFGIFAGDTKWRRVFD